MQEKQFSSRFLYIVLTATWRRILDTVFSTAKADIALQFDDHLEQYIIPLSHSYNHDTTDS